MSWIKKAFSFVRLLDEDGKLSLTNTAIFVILFKLITNPTCDLGSAISLVTVLANYGWKRWVNAQRAQKVFDSNTVFEENLTNILNELSSLKKTVSKLSLTVGLSEGGRK